MGVKLEAKSTSDLSLVDEVKALKIWDEKANEWA